MATYVVLFIRTCASTILPSVCTHPSASDLSLATFIMGSEKSPMVSFILAFVAGGTMSCRAAETTPVPHALSRMVRLSRFGDKSPAFWIRSRPKGEVTTSAFLYRRPMSVLLKKLAVKEALVSLFEAMFRGRCLNYGSVRLEGLRMVMRHEIRGLVWGWSLHVICSGDIRGEGQQYFAHWRPQKDKQIVTHSEGTMKTLEPYLSMITCNIPY